ncbi:DUF3630 family protein [Colwellia ponticola]|uniref:DUF3630 family protein n=1 Tax=Colwellia ponticola TaxID=2304625 RepID=A0A8H2JLU8_9GAMM|nr:DUF3630 family protein [Colwellia ponticola]TMM45624.1 DUF3630 family protein [Colwellia ponticola]
MKSSIPLQYVKSLTYEVSYLSVIFKNEWCQEDISVLTTLLFHNINVISIQEKIIGADRENIRFSWENYAFVLSFDCYSQSCWIEGQDDTSTAQLKVLCSVIKNHE